MITNRVDCVIHGCIRILPTIQTCEKTDKVPVIPNSDISHITENLFYSFLTGEVMIGYPVDKIFILRILMKLIMSYHINRN